MAYRMVTYQCAVHEYSKRSPSSNSKGHFRVPLSLCIKTRLSAQPYDMEMIFHSHANKTHFHKEG